jgi:hypothetical protein
MDESLLLNAKLLRYLPNQICVMSHAIDVTDHLFPGSSLANSQRVNSSPLKQIEAIVMKKMKSACVMVRQRSCFGLRALTIMPRRALSSPSAGDNQRFGF